MSNLPNCGRMGRDLDFLGNGRSHFWMNGRSGFFGLMGAIEFDLLVR
ncbi:hypothetical protein QUB00_02145 [Microcoleus sp. F8_C2]